MAVSRLLAMARPDTDRSNGHVSHVSEPSYRPCGRRQSIHRFNFTSAFGREIPGSRAHRSRLIVRLQLYLGVWPRDTP